MNDRDSECANVRARDVERDIDSHLRTIYLLICGGAGGRLICVKLKSDVRIWLILDCTCTFCLRVSVATVATVLY